MNGKPAGQARLDQEYGMAFQQAGLFDWRNVVKNVELPLELKGWDKRSGAQRAMEMLRLVKLPISPSTGRGSYRWMDDASPSPAPLPPTRRYS